MQPAHDPGAPAGEHSPRRGANYRAPEMVSDRLTRRQRPTSAAESSPDPHLDWTRGAPGGSAAMCTRACSPELEPPALRHF